MSTIKNNEKVWLKEQEQAKELKRIQQLQKQLEEERNLEEIQRIEAAAGRLSAADAIKARRLNWMYEMGPSEKQKEKKKEEEQEKALLGKTEANVDNEDIGERIELVDAESKLREDPLLLMKMRKRENGGVATRKRAGIVRRERGVSTQRDIAESKRKADEREAKRRRKEERRRIREERAERRQRREGSRNTRYEIEVNETRSEYRDNYDSRGRYEQSRTNSHPTSNRRDISPEDYNYRYRNTPFSERRRSAPSQSSRRSSSIERFDHDRRAGRNHISRRDHY